MPWPNGGGKILPTKCHYEVLAKVTADASYTTPTSNKLCQKLLAPTYACKNVKITSSQTWSEETQKCNSIMSAYMNALIATVGCHEVRWERRGHAHASYLICLFQWYAVLNMLFPLLEIFTVQKQLIGSINDTMHLGKEVICCYTCILFVLNFKMALFKNISKERFSHLNLFCCHEFTFLLITKPCYFSWVQMWYWSQALWQMIKREYEGSLEMGFQWKVVCHDMKYLGTHSIYKGFSACLGHIRLPKYWVQICGHWKDKRCQVDTYIDVNLPYPDAHIFSTLIGSWRPCKFNVEWFHHLRCIPWIKYFEYW